MIAASLSILNGISLHVTFLLPITAMDGIFSILGLVLLSSIIFVSRVLLAIFPFSTGFLVLAIILLRVRVMLAANTSLLPRNFLMIMLPPARLLLLLTRIVLIIRVHLLASRHTLAHILPFQHCGSRLLTTGIFSRPLILLLLSSFYYTTLWTICLPPTHCRHTVRPRRVVPLFGKHLLRGRLAPLPFFGRFLCGDALTSHVEEGGGCGWGASCAAASEPAG